MQRTGRQSRVSVSSSRPMHSATRSMSESQQTLPNETVSSEQDMRWEQQVDALLEAAFND